MLCSLFFFFNDTAPPEIYPLPLHDALPISTKAATRSAAAEERSAKAAEEAVQIERTRLADEQRDRAEADAPRIADRKSTRLNSSHANISYAVFCLKKKNNKSHLTLIIPSLL